MERHAMNLAIELYGHDPLSRLCQGFNVVEGRKAPVPILAIALLPAPVESADANVVEG